jgi:diguanylate cyclase (GGDEF)-like protein
MLRRAVAGVVAVVAGSMLVAWASGMEVVMRTDSLALMTPLACVGFLAAAGAVSRLPRSRFVGAVGGAIAMCAGAAGLADALLADGDKVNEAVFGVPAAVSSLTASALVLLGAGLALDGQGWAVTRWLAAAAGTVGGAALIGFMLGVPLFYGPARSVEMSWQAALCALLLALGLGAAHPDGLVARLVDDQGLAGRYARRTLAAVVGIPVASGTLATAAARAGWWDFSIAAWVMTLAAVVGLAFVAATAVARLAEDDRRLTELAIRDPLTGAYNRRHFTAEAQRAVARAQRYGEAAAIAVIDLDHFKEINDRWGHAAGDEALVRVYRSLRARLRSSDVLGRIGGDEFAALILHVDDQQAARVAQEMRDAVLGVASELAAEGQPSALSASVGVAPVAVDERCDVAALIDRADQRMYLEKRSRRSPNRARAGVGPAPGR